jgi:HK97 family phage major capsid protein
MNVRLEHKNDDGNQKAPEKVIREVMGAFEEYKSKNDQRLIEIEKKGSADVLFGDQLKKMDTFFDKFEAQAKDHDLTKKALAEATERFDRLETAMKRSATKSDGGDEIKNRVAPWTKAVANAFTMGMANLSVEQQKAVSDIGLEYKALNIATETAGGFLAPSEYVREIIKGVTEISPARALARVRSTANKSIQLPKRTGQFSASRVIEQGTKTESTGLAYGMDEILAPEAYAFIDITNDLLEDSAFDMQAEISMEATEQFAKLEGTEFVSGTGIGEMEGILTNSSVGETVSGAATTITADGLISLKYAVKSDYMRNGTYILNRTSIGSVRKLKDTTNQYLWMPGIAQGRPNTIDGDGYVEVPDMPLEGAGLYPVAYGDFKRGYTMVDRIAMEMLRDPFTQSTTGKIRFLFRRRSGGKVTLAEAIRKLKCST